MYEWPKCIFWWALASCISTRKSRSSTPFSASKTVHMGSASGLWWWLFKVLLWLFSFIGMFSQPYWGYACIWASQPHAASCENAFDDLLEEPTIVSAYHHNLLLELNPFIMVLSLVWWGLSQFFNNMLCMDLSSWLMYIVACRSL